jgi:hypothetical protein
MPNPSELERAEQEQTFDRAAPSAQGEVGVVIDERLERHERLKQLDIEMQRFDAGDIVPPATSLFEEELQELINRYSLENASNTPDFILARYLRLQLDIFDRTIRRRDHWYGRTEKLVPWMEPSRG